MSTTFLTYPSGHVFDFADPREEHVCIEDIAWSLAQTLRFNGHTRHAYSVASHSIGVSHLVPADDALEGLLHDAAEAYVGDVVRPLKKMLGRAFGEIEDRVERVIAAKFGLRWPWPESVKAADLRMLAAERLQLQVHPLPVAVCPTENVVPAPLYMVDTFSPAGVARWAFRDRFETLMAQRGARRLP